MPLPAAVALLGSIAADDLLSKIVSSSCDLVSGIVRSSTAEPAIQQQLEALDIHARLLCLDALVKEVESQHACDVNEESTTAANGSITNSTCEQKSLASMHTHSSAPTTTASAAVSSTTLASVSAATRSVAVLPTPTSTAATTPVTTPAAATAAPSPPSTTSSHEHNTQLTASNSSSRSAVPAAKSPTDADWEHVTAKAAAAALIAHNTADTTNTTTSTTANTTATATTDAVPAPANNNNNTTAAADASAVSVWDLSVIPKRKRMFKNQAVQLAMEAVEDIVVKIHTILMQIKLQQDDHSKKWFADWRNTGYAPLLDRLTALSGVLDKRLDLLLKVLSLNQLL